MFAMLLTALLWLVFSLVTFWGALALKYRLSWTAPWRQLCIVCWVLAGAGWGWLAWRGAFLPSLAGMAAQFGALLLWWRRIRPRGGRDWAPDLTHLATGRVGRTEEGERLHLDHVRCFEWETRERAEMAWERRSYDLARLDSLDLFVSRWGRPGVAHVLFSFGFGDGEDDRPRFVTFSVEVRRERGEPFSEIGGFFKQYELAIVAADERDIVRLRSNVRGESVTLYRVLLGESERRALLLALVEEANRLAESPRFYHTIRANCTTLVFALMRRIVSGLPLDHRLLFTGLLPGYVHDRGGFAPGHELAELTRLGDITQRAREAHDAEDFSLRIRRGVPGWE